ncbi:MAG TPA: hypothetical protein VIV11_26900 [Kofleriaceae bacterium]
MLVLVLGLVACKSDSAKAKEGSANVITSRVLEDVTFSLPDGWTTSYEEDTDTRQFASSDGKAVRLERADERYVASPDAFMRHLEPRFKGKLMTIERRKNVSSGFAVVLAIFASAKDSEPVRATFVVRELGSAWYSCWSEGTDDEAAQDQVIALCRSVRL